MKTRFHLSILTIGTALFINACRGKEQAVAPKRQSISEQVFASGALEPEGLYRLTAQSDGYLMDLGIEEGDMLRTGQVVAHIDNGTPGVYRQAADKQLRIAKVNLTEESPALQQLAAQLELAKTKLEHDQKQANRYAQLQESQSIARIEYENALLAVENSRTQLRNLQAQYAAQQQLAQQQLIARESEADAYSISVGQTLLKVPVGGMVYKKYKQAGDFVRRGEVVALIGQAQNLYAKLYIDERYMSRVRIGQPVTLRLNAQKERSYKGRVRDILPAFDEQNQAFVCKVEFIDSLEFALSGTQLEANIEIGLKPDALIIPRSYLGYGDRVQLARNDSLLSVHTGIVSTEWVEITAGLSESDSLVSIKPKK